MLRLSSEQFWALTPRELACAIEVRTGRGGAALSRMILADLMKRYPDGR